METKKLVDNSEVPMSGFIFLTSWNKADNHKTIKSYFKVNMVSQLNIIQYVQLFTIATNRDLDILVEIFKEKIKKTS
jgi:hypothetical protein